MMIEAVLRAVHILKMQPGFTMPLARLHGQLIRELGPEAGTYSQIYQQLQKRAESFLVLDSARHLGGTEEWPRAVRDEYSHALDNAGLGCCVRVTLTETPPQPEAEGLIAAVNRTMAELAAAAEEDPGLKDFTNQATQHLVELSRIMLDVAAAHPTTPLPGPQCAE